MRLIIALLVIGSVCPLFLRADDVTARAGNNSKEAAGQDLRIKAENLPALMAKYKPGFIPPKPATNASETFDRIDVVIEHFQGQPSASYISIARTGNYLYIVDGTEIRGKAAWPPANLMSVISPDRLKDLQQLVEETNSLTEPGGEGRAEQLHADRMEIALTVGKTIKKITLNGIRPAPYEALQKYVNDLVWQERLYYRLTRVPDQFASATHDLRDVVESALSLPGRGPLLQVVDFNRYHDLFAKKLKHWYTGNSEDLCTAVELMGLLNRTESVVDIARLRFDRDSRIRSTVAQVLPTLNGTKSIRYLVEMIESTPESRMSLIQLGEAAVPTIASLIEADDERESTRGVDLIRAYIDNWQKLPKPIDRRIINAVLANLQMDPVRDRSSYHKEFLKLTESPEPKPLTAIETLKLFLKHLKAGDELGLRELRDHVGIIERWMALHKTIESTTELTLDSVWIDKHQAFAMTNSYKNTVGKDVHLTLFMNLVRGTDWRVSAAIEEPDDRTSQREQYLKAFPNSQETPKSDLR